MSDPAVLDLGDVETEAAGYACGAMIFAVKPHQTSEPHAHSSEESWIVVGGRGECSINGERIGLVPGARVTVPAGAEHFIDNTADEDLTMLGYWWRPAADGQ